MLKSFINWFNTPYYFNPSTKFKFKLSLVFGFLVFLFLYVFEPFTLSYFKEYLLSYTLSIGLIIFCSNFFLLIVPPLLFKTYFNEDNWTIGKNVIFIFLSILFMGSILWYNGYLFKLDKDIQHISYLTFIYYSFLVGTFPILFAIYINERTLRERRAFKAKEITARKKYTKDEKITNYKNDTIVIKSNTASESLEFKICDLVYISSQGNYTSFFILKDKNILKENVLRVTLQKTLESLKEYDAIIRCHKSYIINTSFVKKISGNARGYLLELDHVSFQVPVSRSFSKNSIKNLLN